jgi:hypothetical protein
VGVEGPLAPGSDHDAPERAFRVVVEKTRCEASEPTCPTEDSLKIVGGEIYRLGRRVELRSRHARIVENPQNDRPAVEVDPTSGDGSTPNREESFVEPS